MATPSATVPGFRSASARRGLAAHQERLGIEGLEPGLLGLMLFVASEVMFFAGLFGAYFTFRSQYAEWPPLSVAHVPIERLGVPYAAWLTVVLVTSSITMQLAVFAIRQNRQAISTALIGVTILLGTGFIIGQGVEWHRLPFNIKDGIFPSLFYTITGFHGLHVIGGLLALTFLAVKSFGGAFSAENHTMVESVSFYWHFVDVVWIGVFTTLYILH